MDLVKGVGFVVGIIGVLNFYIKFKDSFIVLLNVVDKMICIVKFGCFVEVEFVY